MPLYEYGCKKCGKRIEALHSFSDPPLKVCETCGGSLKRLPSSPSIQFKGSGWYVNDYGKGDSKKNASSSTASAASGDAAPAPKTGSSPAPAPAPGPAAGASSTDSKKGD